MDLVHLALGVLLAANPVRPSTDERRVPGSHPAARLEVVAELPEVHGASDLALDPSGRAWVVTEREHTLVPVRPPGAPRPIEGVPEGVDLEGLAFVGDQDFLLGTERHGARTTDTVLEGRIEGDRARVVGERTVDYAALGLAVAPNQGLEGLCAASGHIALALETPIVEGGQRWATLIVDGAPVRLRLGSATGKLSALACALGGDGALELWAIERHYGVARLLRARVDLARPSAPIEPELWTNLAALPLEPLPNFEGVARVEGALWLVDDDAPSLPGVRTRVVRVVTTSSRAGS